MLWYRGSVIKKIKERLQFMKLIDFKKRARVDLSISVMSSFKCRNVCIQAIALLDLDLKEF